MGEASHCAGKAALLIAPPSSYRIAPYIDAGRRLGMELLVASQGEHSLVSEVASGIHVDLSNPASAADAIVGAARARSIHGVIGTDDSTVPLACAVAQRLGLVHNPVEAAILSRRKDRARARLSEAGVPVPAHRRIDLTAELGPQVAGIDYPCVVKPLALSGSRGVIRTDDPGGLAKACRRVQSILEADHSLDVEERTHVLVEQFVDGPEVALEGLLADGRLEVLALFDKPDPLQGPYFEETYYVTPSRHSAAVQQRVARRVQQACAAYGLRQGPVHAEVRLQGSEAWIMEVAARTIGGQCARLLRFGTGWGLEELVLAHAVGESLSRGTETGGAGVLMIPIPRAGSLRRVEGVLQAQRVPYVESLEISVREGYELVPLPEGASYLGFVFARAPSAGEAEQALRQAHACLNIVTAPTFQIAAG